MAVRVAINGFGRIGRNVMRAIMESGRKDIEVVAINDLGPVETNAHLFRFDSVHGRFNGEVKVDGDTIDVGRGRMKVTAERDPSKLPHKALGVDIALECTGFFTSKKAATAHIEAGAKRADNAVGGDDELAGVRGGVSRGHQHARGSVASECRQRVHPVGRCNHRVEQQIDEPATALAEAGAERKASKRAAAAARDEIAGDRDRLVLEMPTADRAVRGAGRDDHLGAGFSGRRTFDRGHRDQDRGSPVATQALELANPVAHAVSSVTGFR